MGMRLFVHGARANDLGKSPLLQNLFQGREVIYVADPPTKPPDGVILLRPDEPLDEAVSREFEMLTRLAQAPRDIRLGVESGGGD